MLINVMEHSNNINNNVEIVDRPQSIGLPPLTVDVNCNGAIYSNLSVNPPNLQLSPGFLEIPSNDILLLKTIGKGSFGVVYKARWNGSGGGRTIAVKKVETDTELSAFHNEIRQLSRVTHDNIVQMYGITSTRAAKCLIMEFADGGSLYQFLHCPPYSSYNLSHSLSWLLQCAKAIAYLHAIQPVPIIHRDLKPLNMLLTNRKRVLKICDFGTACDLRSVMTDNRGSTAWMAPEVIRGGRYNEKCDVHSWGMILWEVLTRRIPYEELGQPYRILWQIVNHVRPPSIQGCPAPLEKLMQSCWLDEHSARPTMQEVVDTIYPLCKLMNAADETVSFSSSSNDSYTESCVSLINEGSSVDHTSRDISEFTNSTNTIDLQMIDEHAGESQLEIGNSAVVDIQVSSGNTHLHPPQVMISPNVSASVIVGVENLLPPWGSATSDEINSRSNISAQTTPKDSSDSLLHDTNGDSSPFVLIDTGSKNISPFIFPVPVSSSAVLPALSNETASLMNSSQEPLLNDNLPSVFKPLEINIPTSVPPERTDLEISTSQITANALYSKAGASLIKPTVSMSPSHRTGLMSNSHGFSQSTYDTSNGVNSNYLLPAVTYASPDQCVVLPILTSPPLTSVATSMTLVPPMRSIPKDSRSCQNDSKVVTLRQNLTANDPGAALRRRSAEVPFQSTCQKGIGSGHGHRRSSSYESKELIGFEPLANEVLHESSLEDRYSNPAFSTPWRNLKETFSYENINQDKSEFSNFGDEQISSKHLSPQFPNTEPLPIFYPNNNYTFSNSELELHSTSSDNYKKKSSPLTNFKNRCQLNDNDFNVGFKEIHKEHKSKRHSKKTLACDVNNSLDKKKKNLTETSQVCNHGTVTYPLKDYCYSKSSWRNENVEVKTLHLPIFIENKTNIVDIFKSHLNILDDSTFPENLEDGENILCDKSFGVNYMTSTLDSATRDVVSDKKPLTGFYAISSVSAGNQDNCKKNLNFDEPVKLNVKNSYFEDTATQFIQRGFKPIQTSIINSLCESTRKQSFKCCSDIISSSSTSVSLKDSVCNFDKLNFMNFEDIDKCSNDCSHFLSIVNNGKIKLSQSKNSKNSQLSCNYNNEYDKIDNPKNVISPHSNSVCSKLSSLREKINDINFPCYESHIHDAKLKNSNTKECLLSLSSVSAFENVAHEPLDLNSYLEKMKFHCNSKTFIPRINNKRFDDNNASYKNIGNDRNCLRNSIRCQSRTDQASLLQPHSLTNGCRSKSLPILDNLHFNLTEKYNLQKYHSVIVWKQKNFCKNSKLNLFCRNSKTAPLECSPSKKRLNGLLEDSRKFKCNYRNSSKTHLCETTYGGISQNFNSTKKNIELDSVKTNNNDCVIEYFTADGKFCSRDKVTSHSKLYHNKLQGAVCTANSYVESSAIVQNGAKIKNLSNERLCLTESKNVSSLKHPADLSKDYVKRPNEFEKIEENFNLENYQKIELGNNFRSQKPKLSKRKNRSKSNAKQHIFDRKEPHSKNGVSKMSKWSYEHCKVVISAPNILESRDKEEHILKSKQEFSLKEDKITASYGPSSNRSTFSLEDGKTDITANKNLKKEVRDITVKKIFQKSRYENISCPSDSSAAVTKQSASICVQIRDARKFSLLKPDIIKDEKRNDYEGDCVNQDSDFNNLNNAPPMNEYILNRRSSHSKHDDITPNAPMNMLEKVMKTRATQTHRTHKDLPKYNEFTLHNKISKFTSCNHINSDKIQANANTSDLNFKHSRIGYQLNSPPNPNNNFLGTFNAVSVPCCSVFLPSVSNPNGTHSHISNIGMQARNTHRTDSISHAPVTRHVPQCVSVQPCFIYSPLDEGRLKDVPLSPRNPQLPPITSGASGFASGQPRNCVTSHTQSVLQRVPPQNLPISSLGGSVTPVFSQYPSRGALHTPSTTATTRGSSISSPFAMRGGSSPSGRAPNVIPYRKGNVGGTSGVVNDSEELGALWELLDDDLKPAMPIPSNHHSQQIFDDHKSLAHQLLVVQEEIVFLDQEKNKLRMRLKEQDTEQIACKKRYNDKIIDLQSKNDTLHLNHSRLAQQLDEIRNRNCHRSSESWSPNQTVPPQTRPIHSPTHHPSQPPRTTVEGGQWSPHHHPQQQPRFPHHHHSPMQHHYYNDHSVSSPHPPHN